jgi:hypothetical protein
VTSVGRNGRLIHHSDESHDADIIHNRLLDLLDPQKHMHPGKPSALRILSGILICPEFLSAFLLMSFITDFWTSGHPGKSSGICSKNSVRNSYILSGILISILADVIHNRLDA